MCGFLDAYDLVKLNQDAMKSLNNLLKTNEI